MQFLTSPRPIPTTKFVTEVYAVLYYMQATYARYKSMQNENSSSQPCNLTQYYSLVKIYDMIEELKKVRNSKILDGLRKVSGPITVKLNHLSHAESNKIRLLFENSLNMWHQLSKNDKVWQENRLAGSDTSMTL
ncbi:hypothetical protein Vretifemale_15525 [Volvox reticuliferus]|uniref:Uncharacterized protein n=1 Tax=Volvox reticuliferus TaxID=1737510 RepID=A0A8J4CRW8_9CHLO|nr:hypothetical protein Vretifemale_15525 [Volvox reticuliferus]